ncbi:MAG: chemotaxis protein CheW [Bacteroidota bacterium]
MKTDQISDQFVLFRMEEELFGVDVFTVMEVIQHQRFTKIPDMPDYVLGAINLRGNVVPVIDLKNKMGLGTSQVTKNTRILIMNYEHEDFEGLIGVMADEVSEVLRIDPTEVRAAPEVGSHIKTEYIHGMIAQEHEETEEKELEQESFIILLDLNKMLRDAGLSLIEENESEKVKEFTDEV